jgi:hypothetical protein
VRREEAEPAVRADELRIRAIVAAVEQAQARGEAVSLAEAVRNRGRNIGRTVQETLQWVSAQQVREDARRLARARRAFAAFLEGHGGDGDGDLARGGRRRRRLQLLVNNTSANPADLGPAAVTAGTGYDLAAGASVVVELGPGDGQLFAMRSAAADAVLAVLRTGV